MNKCIDKIILIELILQCKYLFYLKEHIKQELQFRLTLATPSVSSSEKWHNNINIIYFFFFSFF